VEGYNSDRYNLAISGVVYKRAEVGGHTAGRKNWKIDSARNRVLRGFEVQGEDVARFSA